MQIRVTPRKRGQVTRASVVTSSCHAALRVGGGAVDKSWVDCDRAMVRRRYDRLAKFIPLFDRLLFLPLGLRRSAVEHLRLRGGERVLEIGCGTGIGLAHLSDAVGPGGLGNPLIQPWRELAALCEDFEMRKYLFGSYYICRAVKPSTPAVAEVSDGEAAIESAYRIAAE